MLVQLQGREVWYLQLNEAVSKRLVELMQERGMTQYQLYMKSGVPKSTIGNLVNCAYPSMKLRIIHELCQGLEIDLSSFLPRRCLMKTIWNRRSSDAVLRRGFCFDIDRGGGHSAAPATYFNAASEETIFSAAVHIRS